MTPSCGPRTSPSTAKLVAAPTGSRNVTCRPPPLGVSQSATRGPETWSIATPCGTSRVIDRARPCLDLDLDGRGELRRVFAEADERHDAAPQAQRLAGPLIVHTDGAIRT